MSVPAPAARRAGSFHGSHCTVRPLEQREAVLRETRRAPKLGAASHRDRREVQ